MDKKVIDQKEYLKKYLSSKNEKKKKKKIKLGLKTVKIIDDDIELKNLRPMEKNELDIFTNAEDAPQIAGVVDERGPVDFSDKRRWKIIANDKGDDLTIPNIDRENKQLKEVKNISDDDLSPPRQEKKYLDDDLSPPRLSKKRKKNWADVTSKMYKHYKKNPDKRHDSDMSPPRKRNRDDHTSSNRFKEGDRDYYKSKSSKFRDKYDHDFSHRSYREDYYTKEKRYRHRNIDKECSEKRMKKTLDGKKAGLQDAKALREETEAYRKREADHFRKLSKEVTGVGQAAIVRDKTGKKRNLEAEAIEERERQKRQAELDEKYAKWGRGLKQVEDREEKLKDDLYEMSKPLARYADDTDLDKMLREQEREGDPMLEYIKQKQIKEGKRKPDRPKYEGSFMPNRFGIKPGHRWDGVDRSNGYEKRWFEAQNAKIARQEEAYKWSTSDM
ncbi:BUD13 homolog [Bombus huntii]|uniref:BUD13 homolog n=1 Tax=Bombus huntii TaxID=85661 RepID=UPI0021AA5A05|nr:BUD13 homolog [Bombus huntii]